MEKIEVFKILSFPDSIIVVHDGVKILEIFKKSGNETKHARRFIGWYAKKHFITKYIIEQENC